MGLLHEHQKLSAWKPASGNPLVTFDCTALRDYDSVKAANPTQINNLCSSQAQAAALTPQAFSAAQFLPITAGGLDADDTFDWDSIMLYSSPVGGKIVNGVTQNVLTHADNARSPIPANTKPSAADGARVQALYPPN